MSGEDNAFCVTVKAKIKNVIEHYFQTQCYNSKPENNRGKPHEMIYEVCFVLN